MRYKRNALLEINHSAAQKAYVDWKFEILANLVATPPKERKSNGRRIAYRFTTLSLPVLTPFYRLFYKNERKIIPEITLTPLSLAIWFMDDGHRSYNTIYLNTQQFDVCDQQMLLTMLLDQWNIYGALNRDKDYRRIRISVGSARAFVEIIEQYLLPDLSYKVPTHPKKANC